MPGQRETVLRYNNLSVLEQSCYRYSILAITLINELVGSSAICIISEYQITAVSYTVIVQCY